MNRAFNHLNVPSIQSTMSSPVSKETVAKIDKVVSEFGKFPLHGTSLANPKTFNASPEIVLAMVIDAMIKAKPISHNLTQKTIKVLIEAGYHDIDTLTNTSWDDRVEVLREGGYSRYREQCATNLGELAKFVGKYGESQSISACVFAMRV
jgi:DNA-binding LacI/PurR family transcriptional regulator